MPARTSLARHPDDTPLSSVWAGGASKAERFDWAWLVPRVIHPTKVAIIEAMLWIDRPISASELEKVFEGQIGLGVASYHVKELAKMGVLVRVGERQVRGALQVFYVVHDRLLF